MEFYKQLEKSSSNILSIWCHLYLSNMRSLEYRNRCRGRFSKIKIVKNYNFSDKLRIKWTFIKPIEIELVWESLEKLEDTELLALYYMIAYGDNFEPVKKSIKQVFEYVAKTFSLLLALSPATLTFILANEEYRKTVWALLKNNLLSWGIFSVVTLFFILFYYNDFSPRIKKQEVARLLPVMIRDMLAKRKIKVS